MQVDTAPLLEYRERFLNYVRGKVSDPYLAEDILQDSLVKAVRLMPTLRDDEKLLPWFYRILNNAITDAYRRKGMETRRSEPYDDSLLPPVPEADEATLCACFHKLLPTLKPEYADLISDLDLSEGNPEQKAVELGITRNNLKVRRHRARQALRQKLEATCRTCATHGCLDCTCAQADGSPTL